ncbi:NAD(P)-dependent oxidoreductase (plasmid) [Azospirillum sp. A26]|uniref:NAD-dependent epimerase/dehydratase family protein n=1 Tax=Azospirillum sp. A26 TaxID=3160607 RepID=UPI00366EF395
MRAPMRVLVTGSGGFLGAHVADRFARAGWTVLAAGRKNGGDWRLARLGVAAEPVRLDLTAPGEEIAAAVADARPDLIVHCAAYGVDYRFQDVAASARTNLEGTLHLVRAAAQAKAGRVIHVGSCYEYGPSDRPIGEDALPAPRSLYGITKAAATLAALGTAASRGLALAVVRPFGMYGPLENDTKFVPMILRACRDGRRTELTAGGQLRDYVYVGDVAEACLRLAEMADFPAGEIVNLGSGAPITIRALGEAAAAAVGHGGDALVWGALPYRPDEAMSIVADAAKAAARLGWQASTPLDEGMRRVLAFLDPPETLPENFGVLLCAT